MALTHLDQPTSVRVDLFVGGFNFNPIPPQYLIEFVHERNMADSANIFSFKVFDETALEIELILAKGSQDVLFSYGYGNGGDMSKVYSGMILDYSLEMASGSVTLSVTGSSQVMRSHAKKKTATFNGLAPHDIVRKIAKMEGWKIGYIEDCVPIKEMSNLSIPTLVVKTFRMMKMSPIKFIKEELLPIAVSAKTGEGAYQVYFKDTAEGPAIYFCTPRYTAKPKSNFLMDLNGTGRGKIISFTPEVKGSALMAGAGTLKAAFIDEKGKITEIEHTDGTNKKQKTTGSKSAIAYDKGTNYLKLQGMTLEEARAQLSYFWYKNAQLLYPASCDIIGDPTMEPNSTTNISVVTARGQLHHTSGMYLITKITDSINMGDYTTSLELVKNAVSMGANNKKGDDVNA